MHEVGVSTLVNAVVDSNEKSYLHDELNLGDATLEEEADVLVVRVLEEGVPRRRREKLSDGAAPGGRAALLEVDSVGPMDFVSDSLVELNMSLANLEVVFVVNGAAEGRLARRHLVGSEVEGEGGAEYN